MVQTWLGHYSGMILSCLSQQASEEPRYSRVIEFLETRGGGYPFDGRYGAVTDSFSNLQRHRSMYTWRMLLLRAWNGPLFTTEGYPGIPKSGI